MSLDDAARRTGIGKRKIQSSMSLLKLDEPIAHLVASGQLDEWVGVRLATLSHNGQHRALRVIRENGLTGTDRDRVIGQVWVDEHEMTMFNGALVEAKPEQSPERIRDARERAGKVARLLEELDTVLASVEPDEQTVMVIESVAKTAGRVARAARAARTARMIQ